MRRTRDLDAIYWAMDRHDRGRGSKKIGETGEEVEATVREMARWERLTANDQVTQIDINNSEYTKSI
jgi:hypothetical protein